MFKSGFIAIIGRPNVGKCSLLNRIVGEKLAITTHKPQTTRNRITGIRNLEQGQLVFIDTPGIHSASTTLNRYMVDLAFDTMASVDMILFMVEAGPHIHPGDFPIIESLQHSDLPIILVINKIDLTRKGILLPLIDEFRGLLKFTEIIPISARTGDGVPVLLDNVLASLAEGPKYFPDDQITDLPERFFAAEIIREKIILLTEQEIPYVSAVNIDTFHDEAGRNLIRIQATINIEKDSQKGIIIGKRGSMLKEIGMSARKDLERFFASKVYLELFVKVRKKWTQSTVDLKDLGYK